MGGGGGKALDPPSSPHTHILSRRWRGFCLMHREEADTPDENWPGSPLFLTTLSPGTLAFSSSVSRHAVLLLTAILDWLSGR